MATEKKYREITNEKDLDSLAMRGSYERVKVGNHCVIGFTSNRAARSRGNFPWELDVIGGHEDGDHLKLNSYRTLIEAFRMARKVSRAIDEILAEPELVYAVQRLQKRKEGR